MLSADPARDYDLWESENDRRLSIYPVCDECKEPVTEDLYYTGPNTFICKDCLDRHRMKISVKEPHVCIYCGDNDWELGEFFYDLGGGCVCEECLEGELAENHVA